MDTLQPSDIPDGRGGFMLRDDAAKPRHSEAATLDAKLTEGDVGEALTENKSDEVAASEPVHPDVMQQQEWQDDASSPSGAVSDGVTTLSQNDTLDDHNNSASPDLSHDSDQTVVDNTHLNDQESRPPSAGERAASQTPSGADPSLDDDIHQDTPSDSDDKMPTAAAEGDHSSASHDQATEISATSEPDFAEDEISAPLAQDAGNQAGQFLHHPPSHQNTIPNRVSPTPSTDPSANALLGKISEMLGSLPKIDQHHPTQHPDNTSKHALATARVMFSPQLPAEASPVLSSTQRRGLQRLAHEEGLRQENIERIIAGSLGYLMPQATPDTIDKDWLSHFFDRARLAGDVETQAIWSRVLATKANNPNAQSRKTIAILGEMDRGAQTAFQKLCGFAWRLGYPTLMVYAIDENFFRLSGLSFAEMTDLVAHGLLTIERTAHYVRRKLPRNILVYYGSEPWKLTLTKDNDNVMSLGVASFTRAGIELFNCINPREDTTIRDVIAEHWRGLGFTLVPLAPSRKNPAS